MEPVGPVRESRGVSSDSEIILRSHDDPSAFGILFDRHAANIHRYVARRTNATVADDVMAETFLVAFERRGSFAKGYTDAAPWLFGIATNLLRHHHRREVRALRAMARMADQPTSPLETADDSTAADTRMDTVAALGDVASALRQMPQKQRDTVLLHAWADLTYEQIATAMDVPIGTVRSRLNRARTTLRATTSTRTLELLTGETHG
jgi:RNA polymerase sigma factor (sigma-70 family)